MIIKKARALVLICITGLLFSAAAPLAAQTGDRLFNDGWQYIPHPATLPDGLPTEGWQAVDLPHTWNATDPVDAVPGYRRGAGWYRRSLRIEDPDETVRHLLRFEAANMKAAVYVNGQHAGGHVGGYLGFTVEIGQWLKPGSGNEILVRVDNGVDRDLIPSQKSDFVLYGGITRDVYLLTRPQHFIAALRIDTPRVSAESGTVEVSAQPGGDMHGGSSVRYRLLGPGGEILAETEAKGTQPVTLPEVGSPRLWSPADPALYRIEATLVDASGKDLHRLEEHFGFRWYEFDQNGAFVLNGERLLLRGTHRHEEHAAYGAAMPNELHVRDMEMIKEVGANFVRLGHYPQDPAVYEAADRLGLILWDELPWCRGGIGEDAWKSNTENMLREMIAQNRNHPSVFFWSLGNEIYWLPDFEGGGDEDRINAYLQHLQDVAKAIDPARMTAIRKYYAGSDIVDVFSPSIWAGWYGGGYHQYEQAITDAREKYPRMLHMEYGGSSHVGRFDPAPPGGDGLEGGQVSVAEMVNQSGVVSVAKGGDWSESYIVDLFDWHLNISESFPDFAGNAQWAFKDFSTPLRPENPLPYVNQKGLVDREGRPKEAYWVFKSRWTTDPAFCRLYGHDWNPRQGAKGAPQPFRAYCNTESAELLVNGESLGMKSRDPALFPAAGLTWEAPLKEGVNRIEVVGFANGKEVARDGYELEFTTAVHGKMADILLDKRPRADGRYLLTAIAVDSKGRQVLNGRERIYFTHTNHGVGGRLLADRGTPDGSIAIELANGRAAIVFEPDESGTAVIEVRTQNHKGSYIEIP
jgi:beta-galactosidase